MIKPIWKCHLKGCGFTAPPTFAGFNRIVGHQLHHSKQGIPREKRGFYLIDENTGDVLAWTLRKAKEKGLIVPEAPPEAPPKAPPEKALESTWEEAGEARPIVIIERRKPTLDDMFDETDKAEIRSAIVEYRLAKLRERMGTATKQVRTPTQPKTKRYLVNPETGNIDVDEEEGEYTYKDALLVSGSIQGKSSHYYKAINLINAVSTLSKPSETKIAEKPKEYYVAPVTGEIVHDPKNGEYTLSEARIVSQSLQNAIRGHKLRYPSFYVDEEGNIKELKPGQPIVVTEVVKEPAKAYFINSDGKLEEQDPGKPIVIKVQSSSPENLKERLSSPRAG